MEKFFILTIAFNCILDYFSDTINFDKVRRCRQEET